MMKFYFFIIMLILLINFIKNKFIIMYMYLLLMFMLFMMIFFSYNEFFMNIYYWLGLDSLSYSLLMLSIFIISMMFLVSNNIVNNKLLSMLLLTLLLSLMLSFNSMNYFLFYLFFEISLIPTFILIMMYGYQPERLNASMYMMMYTLFASLPLLIILFVLFNKYNSFYYFFMNNNFYMNYFNDFVFYLYMLFAFLIKLPMFMFHMWLPKAHVEAPISGSMILAGVMLKLGGYGIIRSMSMMLNYCMKYNIYLLSLNMLGVMILSMLCLRQNDLKVMVAYSSVIHMAMMLCSLLTLYMYSKYSSIFLMIGHGLCSPGMFVLVNFFYLRSKTRNMYINKGLIMIFPSMMFWWFMYCVANMAAPVTLNLIGEIFIIISLMNWMNNIMYMLILSMLFCAAYSIYLFSSVSHGSMFNSFKLMFNNSIIEYKLMFMMWIPLNIFIFKLDMFI